MNVVITQSWQQLHAVIDLLYPVVERCSLGLRYYRTVGVVYHTYGPGTPPGVVA